MGSDVPGHLEEDLLWGLWYYNVHTVKSLWTSSATTEMAERCHLCCFSEHNGKLSSYVVIVQVRVVLKRTVVVTDVSTTSAEVIFRVKWIVFVIRWSMFNDTDQQNIDWQTLFTWLWIWLFLFLTCFIVLSLI